MSEPIVFTAEFAGLRFRVDCQYDSTRRYCQAYLTQGDDPWAVISIAPEDIQGEKNRLLRKKNPGQALEASTPQALEVLCLCRRVAELLPKARRVLFHGSVLSFDGQAVLFTAKSGTGKSTHTRLWREVYGDRVVMVNDDKPFLHLKDHGVTVYGNPWQGKHGLGQNIQAPLKAICLVERGQENRLEPLDSRTMLPMLLQQTYCAEAPENMLATLALVEQLSLQVELYRLTCNMDPQAARIACTGIFKE